MTSIRILMNAGIYGSNSYTSKVSKGITKKKKKV